MIRSLADLVRTWARTCPAEPALEFEGRSLTYGALDARSNRVANGLRTAGVERQSRVVFYGRNRPEYFEMLFGAAKINAVTVAVNWRLGPNEVAAIINDATPTVVVVDDDFIESLRMIEPELETATKILLMGDQDGFEGYEAWLTAQDDADPGDESSWQDVALQVYTSGTTGRAKGAMLSNQNLFSSLGPTADRWRFETGDVNLVVLPVAHVAGTWWALLGMLKGCRTVLLREADPLRILEAISAFHVTQTMLVPALLQFLLDLPSISPADVSSLKTVAYGGSPISRQVLERVMGLLRCELIQGYGSTESLPLTELAGADHDPDSRPELLRSCGKPLPWVEMRIVDPTTNADVPTGTIGELWARAPQIMVGYWRQPTETSKALDGEGWFHTGDAGYRDAEGYLYLSDRVKDMIVSGGENIYTAEIENVLLSLADIVDVAVIGVPHEKWGETVKAVVVTSPSSALTESDVIAFARERLGHFKCPTTVDFVSELPRNLSGKVLKRELRQPYWAGRERQIN